MILFLSSMNKHIYILLILVVMLGCRTQKSAIDLTRAKEKATVERIIAAQPDFTTAQANRVRVTVRYAEQQLTSNAAITVQKDSMMILSVQPFLGMEMFRVEIDKEMMRVIDKMNKRYVDIPVAQVVDKAGLAVGYADIEALCLAQLGGWQENNNWTLTMQGDSTVLSFNRTPLQYQYFAQNTTASIVRTTIAEPTTMTTLQADYRDYMAEGIRFPKSIIFTVTYGGTNIACEMQIQQIVFNEAVRLQRADIKRYTPTTIKKLLSK